MTPRPSRRTPSTFASRTSPALANAASSMAPASSLPASSAFSIAPRFTGANSLRKMFLKPRLGSRR